MPNPRFLQTAERWMNKEVPTERLKPKKTPIAKNPFFSGNINYSFLEGDFGRQILEEYQIIANKDYQGASVLNVLSFEDDVVKGSNPFAFILLNQILAQQKMRIATPADLERVLEKEEINLKGTYGDSGLVLRSEGDLNQYLAKNLADQVRQKGYTVGQDPVMIPLAGLTLKYDSNSPHDLSFHLAPTSEIIYAPQLSKENNGNKFDEADEKGLPIFERKGSRKLYSNKKEGLTRLYLGVVLGLVAGNRDLADSDEDGRVIICAESKP